MGAADTLAFNGAAESDGSFDVLSGAGNDVLTGGAQADTFDLSHGGNDNVHGNNGNDTFLMGGALTVADSIDGGAGNDTLVLNGGYSAGLTFGAAMMTNVETLQVTAGNSYNLTLDNANVAAGQTLTVDATGLTVSDQLIFNGGAEINGGFLFKFAGGYSAGRSTHRQHDDRAGERGLHRNGVRKHVGAQRRLFHRFDLRLRFAREYRHPQARRGPQLQLDHRRRQCGIRRGSCW